jgi:hypothetical protein
MSIDEEKLIGLYPELHHYKGWEALRADPRRMDSR